MIETATDRLSRFPEARAEVQDVHDLPYRAGSFDAVLLLHTLTYAERPARALLECARVMRPGGRMILLCLDKHRQQAVTERYGERHPGFTPRHVRRLLTSAGLQVGTADVASRESRKPHLQVVLAIADKPKLSPARNQDGKK
jgi:ArsR family transcriptional regulator